MGIFSKLFKESDNSSDVLVSPVDGKTINLSEVPDPTFSEGILGQGIAIIPSGDAVFSPCDGTIDLMFDTGHAVNIISDKGAEILIHIGLETVSLKGIPDANDLQSLFRLPQKIAGRSGEPFGGLGRDTAGRGALQSKLHRYGDTRLPYTENHRRKGDIDHRCDQINEKFVPLQP